ncbi:MAG: hypothetical protein GXP55_16275 [Deltaproteobacteria bacterium]|nr:hypothetical protein [Deltaproteobacteria bacterium]
MFQGAQDRDGVRYVHPVQAYLDLEEHPERAAEAAERVRAEHLTWQTSMADKPKRASEYKSEQVELVRATCLYVATKLGELMDKNDEGNSTRHWMMGRRMKVKHNDFLYPS